MQPNNKYYKLIAKLLDESIDNRHHTDLYYTKRIAESYGETYTDLGNVNKHLKDFAEDVGVELDGKHHTNRWYLKRIADKLYDDELEYDTENYYLRIISESINPTPPPRLPAEYQEVEYIGTTGTQYINTGYTPDGNVIPCYRKADGVIGLYDLANDVFYTNDGSGTFNKGADV